VSEGSETPRSGRWVGNHLYLGLPGQRWSPEADRRLVDRALAVFPDAVEVDKDDKPIPPEQLSLDEAA
jgi:hypothetical protein